MEALVTLLVVGAFGMLFATAAVLAGVDTRDGRDWRARCGTCGGGLGRTR